MAKSYIREKEFVLPGSSRKLEAIMARRAWHAGRSRRLAGSIFHPYTGNRKRSGRRVRLQTLQALL